MRILIVGAGGHGQVIADALLVSQTAQVPMGFLDDNPLLWRKEVLGLPVYGGVDQISILKFDALIVGIGDNGVRQRFYNTLRKQGLNFATVLHPQSVIGAGVSLGLGSFVAAQAVVGVGSKIGQNVILNTGCTVDHHAVIGDHVHIAPGARLGGEVVVEEKAFIGMGAVVLPQRHLGSSCVIGASSAVLKDVEVGMTVVGIPARRK